MIHPSDPAKMNFHWHGKVVGTCTISYPRQSVAFGCGWDDAAKDGVCVTASNHYFRSRLAMFFYWLAMKIEGKA